MFAKLKELREEREGGFTLIELLVVILIIGILAAIAIPMFLNQRKSAVDSSVQSDVKNAATQVESSLIKAQGANVDIKSGTVAGTLATLTGPISNGNINLTVGTAPAVVKSTATVTIGSGTKITVSGTSSAYCVLGANTGGDVSATATKGIVYKSDAGGLQSGAGDCTGY